MTQKNLKIDPSKIQHDPVMCQRYVEAMNAAIDYEIKLTRRENNVQEIRPKSTS